MHTELTRETKPIKAVYDAHFEDGICFRVATCGVSKIEPYEENGEQCYIPRVKIYKNGEIYCTLPINNLCIEYEQE